MPPPPPPPPPLPPPPPPVTAATAATAAAATAVLAMEGIGADVADRGLQADRAASGRPSARSARARRAAAGAEPPPPLPARRRAARLLDEALVEGLLAADWGSRLGSKSIARRRRSRRVAAGCGARRRRVEARLVGPALRAVVADRWPRAVVLRPAVVGRCAARRARRGACRRPLVAARAPPSARCRWPGAGSRARRRRRDRPRRRASGRAAAPRCRSGCGSAGSPSGRPRRTACAPRGCGLR